MVVRGSGGLEIWPAVGPAFQLGFGFIVEMNFQIPAVSLKESELYFICAPSLSPLIEVDCQCIFSEPYHDEACTHCR